MDFDISKLGFSAIANFSTKARAEDAARKARRGKPRAVYTRFTKAWVVGEWRDGYSEEYPDRMHLLLKDGTFAPAYIRTETSCLGRRGALVLHSDRSRPVEVDGVAGCEGVRP